MKIKKNHLMRIVRGDITLAEAKKLGYVLNESLPEPSADQFLQSDPLMYENTSIDSQVDKFIMQADSGGQEPGPGETPAPAQESFLREAEEDDAAGAPPPPKPVKKMSDLMGFATEVAQLVEKSDALLDVKGAIVRRALNYVTKTYDTKQAKDVERILDANFDIQADPTADSYEDVDVPLAQGAGGPPSGG
jgi:hypothetical protein